MAQSRNVTITCSQVSTSKRMKYRNDVVTLPYGEAKNLVDKEMAVLGDKRKKEEPFKNAVEEKSGGLKALLSRGKKSKASKDGK